MIWKSRSFVCDYLDFIINLSGLKYGLFMESLERHNIIKSQMAAQFTSLAGTKSCLSGTFFKWFWFPSIIINSNNLAIFDFISDKYIAL